MSLCPNCATPIEAGRFCGKCGGRMSRSSQSTVPAAPLSAAAMKITEKPGTGKSSAPELVDIDQLALDMKQNPGSVSCYLRLAEGLVSIGKVDRAFSTFRAAKALAPDDPRVFKIGGKIFELLGRTEDAFKAWRQALKIDPTDLDSALQSARLLYETGRRQKALEILERLRSRAHQHPNILLKIAEIRLGLGDFPSAQEDLSLYRKLAGETLDMYLLLGKAMLSQDFFDGAIRHYREGLARYPTDPNMLLGLGKALLGTGDRGQALLELERAFQNSPNQIEILIELGRLYNNLGLTDKAEEIFDQIRQQPVRDGDVFLTIARIYQARSLPERALEELERAQKLSPHHPDIIRMLGEVYESKRDFSRAQQEYERYLEGIPTADWALQGVIRTAIALGDDTRVSKAQKSLLQSGQETPDLWCDLGETLIRLQKFVEAGKAFEAAAKLDPTCVRAYQAPELIKIEKARAQGTKLVSEARDAVTRKLWHTAMEKLERALDLVPREVAWTRLLAEVNLKIGAITRAAERLSRVRAARSDDFWVGYQLARVYEFEEKHQLAIELLSSVMKDHPAEFEGHLALLRMKRSQIQGERFERDMITSMVRNLQAELTRLPKNNPLPQLLEALTLFIFGMGSRFQGEALKRAEEIFEEILYRFPDHQWAHRGLSLVFRSRGDFKKGAHHLQEVVKLSSDPGALFALARLNENFQNFSEARKYYVSLRNLFPENGLYRRRTIEMTARELEPGRKDDLVDLIARLQEQARTEASPMWTFHDLAWAQSMMARRSPQREEWAKRAFLTWNKAATQPETTPWIFWGFMETQTEFLRGAEKTKALNNNLKVCERMVREHPEMARSHAYMGICHLGFDDLTQTDRASKHLETATFLDPIASDLLLLLSQTYRALGKTSRVDVLKQNMILLEPEITLKM
jgi:tetratricopeptide (TPR) repeat protein